MRFQFVEAQKAEYPIKKLCRVVQVSRSGFYAWRNRPTSRRQIDSPRVHAELRAQGVDVGVNRVARLMRENGLCVKPRRGYRCTTKTDPAHPVAPDRLKRDFTATEANEKWVTDVTYLRTEEGWLYLAIVLDLFNREVVGWAMGTRIDRHLTLSALDMALARYGVPQGLIHHSDRGSTYTASAYRKRLKKYGISCSMSRAGNCWDNSVAESFFATLKKELIYRKKLTTRKLTKSIVFEYIEVFYNRTRRHSLLGYKSPVDYRQSMALST